MKKIALFIIILMLMLSFPAVCGDGGIIGPPQIYIQEKAQNAIVAWNGTEEVLILSIDIQSSEPTKVLRVIPLPSNPISVTEGSFDSFVKLQEIINKKWQEIWNRSKGYGENAQDGGTLSANIEITFQDTIGVHNITIVKILDVTNFSDWATDFAISAGLTDITFSSKFQGMVEEYLNDNISYFVFDIIDTTKDESSINPIIYRFKTDFLFYPLKITAAADVGETYASVRVFCIAKKVIKAEVFSEVSFYSNLGYYSYGDLVYDMNLTEDELLEISQEIYDLFKGDPILMSYQYYGRYSSLDGDIIAFEEDFAYPDLDIIAEDNIFVERGEKSIVNVTVKNTGNTNLNVMLDVTDGLEWLEHSWFSIQPSWYIDMDVDEETTFQILFDIPVNIALGDYSVTYDMKSSNYGPVKQKNIVMTIYDKTEGGPGLYQDVQDLKTEMSYLVISTIFCIFLIAALIVVVIATIFKKR